MIPTIEDETRCVVDGVEYHAVTQLLCHPVRPDEHMCAFIDDLALCRQYGMWCTADLRADRSDVIWVRAE